jgi:hypothetical protein
MAKAQKSTVILRGPWKTTQKVLAKHLLPIMYNRFYDELGDLAKEAADNMSVGLYNAGDFGGLNYRGPVRPGVKPARAETPYRRKPTYIGKFHVSAYITGLAYLTRLSTDTSKRNQLLARELESAKPLMDTLDLWHSIQAKLKIESTPSSFTHAAGVFENFTKQGRSVNLASIHEFGAVRYNPRLKKITITPARPFIRPGFIQTMRNAGKRYLAEALYKGIIDVQRLVKGGY